MLVIGVTGGIGTGKSEVSRYLEQLGATVIDADRVGHSVYEPDTPGWREVVETFGEEVLQANREVDRRKLGSIVFGDPAALEKLNAITHPKIRQKISDQVEQHRAEGDKQAVVVEAAILIEAGWTDLVDEVWVSIADPDTVVRRVQERNNLSEEQIRSRVRSQMSQEERLGYATVAVDNDGGLEDLHKKLRELWDARVAGKA